MITLESLAKILRPHLCEYNFTKSGGLKKNASSLGYTANVDTLSTIYDVLVEQFGQPTYDHRFLAEIIWVVGKQTISVQKADSVSAKTKTSHSVHLSNYVRKC